MGAVAISENRKDRPILSLRKEVIWVPNPWQQECSVLSHGDGQLDSYAPMVSTLWLDNQSEGSRCKLRTCGIFALKRAPVSRYGQGPHYLLVMHRQELRQLDLFRQVKDSCSQFPFALIGSASRLASIKKCKADCLYSYLPRVFRDNGRGKIIGIATFDQKKLQYSVNLTKRGSVIRIYPLIIFQTRKKVERRMKIVSDYIRESPTNTLHFIRQDMKSTSLQIVSATIANREVSLPNINFKDLTYYVDIIDDVKSD